MFAHSDSSNNARPREPVRTSTLRHVTSTLDNLEADEANPLQQPPAIAPKGLDQTPPSKLATIGVHDASSTTSTALLHPHLFPQAFISRGTVVNICPVDEYDAKDYARPHHHASDVPNKSSAKHGSGNGTKGYLFVAEPMGLDPSTNPTVTQVSIASSEATRYGLRPQSRVLVSILDPDEYAASHVEIAFRDEYLSRSDMWRLVVAELAGKMVSKGQRIAFMGTIKVFIKAIYRDGQRVQSAIFSAFTKPIFRSESARYVLFIQMSKEMWDFDTDSSGQIMFDKVTNGFLPDLFKRWQQINARHLVTIVMFSRLEFKPQFPGGPISFGAQVAEQAVASGPPLQDYFRVVVSDMPSGDWSDILLQLKKEFKVFLRDVSIRHPVDKDHGDSDPESLARLPSVITGSPLPALHGNILQAVNLASSQFSCDYIDRDLVRTGISVIVVTPGTGLFEVDYTLLATTTDNLIDNGVGIDLVCLSRLPLHSVPLFKYRPPKSSRPRGSDVQPDKPHGTLDDPSREEMVAYDRRVSLRASSLQGSTGSNLGSSRGSLPSEWNYAIPHWIDVSYWTSPSDNHQIPIPTLGIGGHDLATDVANRRGRKPFIPRARMYELQMMGVMENSIDQIHLPYLQKSTPDSPNTPGASIPFADHTPTERLSSSQSNFQLKRTTDPRFYVQSSSLNSASSLYAGRNGPQYRWMEEYDAGLFQHPARRHRQQGKLRPSNIMRLPSNRSRQRDRVVSRSGVVFSASDYSQLSSTQSSSGRGEQENKRKEGNPKGEVNKSRPSIPDGSSTTSHMPQSRPAKASRQLSLGFRGLGVSTTKATASTEVSMMHAGSKLQPTQRKSHDNRSTLSTATEVSEKQSTTDSDSSFGTKPEAHPESGQRVPDTTGPIPIRKPSRLEGWQSSPSNQSTMRPDFHGRANSSCQQHPLLSTDKVGGDQVQFMSPSTAMAPWLTVVNPSNPKAVESNSTSRLGRWQHIFPKKLRASKIKWKSLCSPAAVPLTTEEFPPADELATDYESSKYQVGLLSNDELLERPRAQDWLIREMMAFRFAQGFQVVIGLRLADALFLPNFQRFDVFDDSELAKTDTTIVMSRGSVIHKIAAAGSGHVEVERLTRRSTAPKSSTAALADSDTYKPMIRTMLGETYLMQSISMGPRQRKYDWNMIDNHIAGHSRQDVERYNESLRSWRARLVLVPVNPSSSVRRPLQPLNEDNEEELRLEGIRKLTQLWQRFRYIPPAERRFQTPVRRRKDTNPLDIMYQTRNPSSIVAAEKDNMGEDVSTAKPVQLLPESELFQRSNLNLQSLAQTIQGEKGVRLMDRRWHWRLHYNCFIGFELTSWLLQNFRDVETREEAVELGNDLMTEGLFQHVEQRHNFRDGNYFYQIATEYRSARPESRNTWFGGRKAEKVPATPLSDGPGQESPKAPASRPGSAREDTKDDALAPNTNRQRLGVALSKSLLYDVDHRKRSYRPELITLHYDRIHNPDNCYHIRIDWMNVTSKLIEDAIVSWAAAVDRFGLRLVEVPLAEASAITSMHPFRAPALVKLAKSPPPEQPQTYFEATSFTPQAKLEKHLYQKALMKKFDFVLDFEAASDFPADVDVTYSWGKPDYKYPQYVHRSGTALAQITDDGHFLLLANRLYNTRTQGPQEMPRSDNAREAESGGIPTAIAAARSSKHRGSPLATPYSSPLVRPSADPRLSKPASSFSTPEHIKKQFEAFCADAAALENFYNDVLSKASTPAAGTPHFSTPMMESSIPALGLPPSVVERGKSPAPEAGKPKTRIVGGSPRLGNRASGDLS
ncbi:MAG: hypothetical protein LQ344_001381 [Seirophora lacunosa]|nr:MAG: hypothetical protein LQ344_001381 [Seirophora lacunosa]